MQVVRWHRAHRRGARLWCADYGGDGPPVVLLHGLAGHAAEWAETASWLSLSHRVIAPEQRGHGRSERAPADMSRTAFVDDARMWIRRLAREPAIVVGQSLGGHTAFLLAARHPECVRGLVVVEATPEADPEAPRVVRAWLRDWPIPFGTRRDALEFFGGDTLRGWAWSEGLEQRDGTLWPRFEPDVMLASLAESARTSSWDEWRCIRCPVLVVRAERGVSAELTARMVAALPSARVVEIAGAGHDVHLDRPVAWREALEGFLSLLDTSRR